MEVKNLNKSKVEWHEMAQDGKNVEATGTETDASLAQACSLDVHAHIDALRALQEKHGKDSLVWRICSNVIPMLRNLPTYVRPSWATHESQTLQGRIKRQLNALEAALQGR